MKAYLEPNAINWARRASWSGDRLRSQLAGLGLAPHFGIHGIYELSRGLLSEQGKGAAQQNFRVLADLDPFFEPMPEMLLAKELDHLRTGAVVIPVLGFHDQCSAKWQVNEMAAGRLEPEGAQFVSRRQEKVSRDHPHFVAKQLEKVRRDASAGEPRPKTFEEVLARFDADIPDIIQQRFGKLGENMTRREAYEIHAKLGGFPAIRSVVRADLYLWAIPLMHGTGAGRDKTDDYRHVVEASYAKVFVTGDTQLASTVPRLHPDLEVLTWNKLRSGA